MSSKGHPVTRIESMVNPQKPGEPTDLTIICSSYAYKVHKAIVCPQSEFFRRMFRKHTNSAAEFKESQSGIVEIPCRKVSANATERVDFMWDPDADDPKLVRLMVHYFYHLDYLETETARLKSQDRRRENFDRTHILSTGILINHASMYAMGDKYDIPGLRNLAVTKYWEAYEHTSAGFANSMIVAWTSTIDSDMGLRSVIIRILNSDTIDLMSKPKVNQNVRDLPLLSHALLEKKRSRPKNVNPYWPIITRLTRKEALFIDYLGPPPRDYNAWESLRPLRHLFDSPK